MPDFHTLPQDWKKITIAKDAHRVAQHGRTVASIDFETRGVINLSAAGVNKYALDEHTGIWCMAWAIGDDPVSIWFPGDPDPHKLLEHIETGGVISGWNVNFEFCIWLHTLSRICPHWPVLKVEQLDDTMARSYVRSCPGTLKDAAIAINVPFKKDEAGHRLMMKMCKPKLEWTRDPVGPPKWHDKPADLKRLGEYCIQDVVVERALSKKLAPLTNRERQIWLMDRAINRRGVCVDEPKVRGAMEICDEEKKRINKELYEITDGNVKSATNVIDIVAWLNLKGVPVENLKKRQLSRLLRTDHIQFANDPDIQNAKRVIELRLEAAKASTAKLKAMLNSRDDDDRCRDLFSYHVATTGRWAGRRIQLQNMMRPEGRFDNDDYGEAEIEACIELFDKPNAIDCIRYCFADPLPAVASCMRGLIIAGEGKKFVGGDFTGIENRTLMWLAGEEWQLEELRKFDRGEGVDNYKLTYSRSFGVPLNEVTKKQRLIGKVASLACIAEGQLVLTDAGLVPIERVTPTQRVWDGIEFVKHDGVVCRGEKETITYDGLTATRDHVVWVEGQSEPIQFGLAAASGKRLVRSGDGRTPIRLGRSYTAGASVQTRLAKRLRVGRERKSIWPARVKTIFAGRTLTVRDSRIGYARSREQTKELARHTTTTNRVRVYDIINAGVRNRFTVSDRLVHNCGYSGAVGAYLSMGDNYDVIPGDVARAIREVADAETWARVSEMYPGEDQAKWRFGLDVTTWTGIRIAVEAWRDANPNVAFFWKDLVDCATQAVMHPKRVFKTRTGLIRFSCDATVVNGETVRNFLFMQLPSKRCIAYARPSIVKNKIAYYSVGKKTKRWEQRALTASILSENAASGTARDVLTDAMLRLEASGYPISLHVHDEAVSEVDIGFGSPAEFEQIMCDSAEWIKDMPVSAKAWSGKRFRK